VSQLLKTALYYRSKGFSVIPTKRDKRPYLSWEQYQRVAADEKTIQGWWNRWPDAQVAIICGAVSGITVIDADSEAGREVLESEYFSDSLMIPTVKTARGWHYYFSHADGIGNSVKAIVDCDVKNDGGYVLAPPSVNNKGNYEWVKGLRIDKVALPPMPDFLKDILQQASFGTDNATRIDSIHSRNVGTHKPSPKTTCLQKSTLSTSVVIDFGEGSRDNSIFHVANCLVKGGMNAVNIRECLEFIASNCNPPFPQKEIPAKIQSALKRSEDRDRNLTQEVYELILSTSGNITTTFIYQSLNLSTRKEKKHVGVILSRFVKKNLIEKTGNRAGEYRIVEGDCNPEDWANADTEPTDIYLPFELTDVAVVTPGDIILVMGSQNAGKSAILMNIAKENRDRFKVHYFSSEMRKRNFKRRMAKFKDVGIGQLAKRIQFYERTENFADVIKSGEGNLNILDYIEMHDQFWLVSKVLAEIYKKLDGALCVAAIQKQPGAEYGRGGSFTQEKPVLSVSVDNGVAVITKCKEWRDELENPNRKQFYFKLRDGCQLSRRHFDLGWHKKLEE
jgi:hypothetical protein